jgi:A/G-specific adenine glycosylase
MPALYRWTKQLLHWYRRNRRDLPWRRTQDPYAIWISEIMLQQTTVEAVIPYYERFLKRFPTVLDLAKADLEDVLKLWSGLGYYSRARNLHKAAGMIRDGAIPDTVEGLQKLPGIGRYTAGAIASIAFGKRAPIVDGNVIRVLSRLFAISEDPKSTVGRKIFWKKAEEVLPHKHCGDFNQALMELGATVCSPENPTCLLCPVTTDCRARKERCPEDFPKPKKKTVYRDVLMSAAVIPRGGRIFFVRRSSQGLLRDFWELPMVEGNVEALRKNWLVEVMRPLPVVRHSVLNRRLKIAPFLCTMTGKRKQVAEARWFPIAEIQNIATSSMNRKILKHFGA